MKQPCLFACFVLNAIQIIGTSVGFSLVSYLLYCIDNFGLTPTREMLSYGTQPQHQYSTVMWIILRCRALLRTQVSISAQIVMPSWVLSERWVELSRLFCMLACIQAAYHLRIDHSDFWQTHQCHGLQYCARQFCLDYANIPSQVTQSNSKVLL